MSNYLAITQSSLIENTKIGCDLYLENRVNGTFRYILFCRGDKLFDSERKGELIRQNIERLFI